ncbi:LPS export ABC transporter periplasmic protein LptC [Nitratiruptor sp. YY09-18]|uniref:LPS export ABC transporter periplasmic protein LptC n=1 Tax=Nitratiruptor sp. YY09-18 TaxID=2724901 RepID=UPI0019169123|nr:LPS export ABC transporter periplasmic protein LptC [Nitratiruptor sp. YY09-18]BCD67995.1 lipopolysaccharide export system protein LptC [Nitratiruptor sp. YY09-18]
MKIVTILGLLLLFIALWFAFFHPFNVTFSKKDLPEIEFHGFKYQEITPQGIQNLLQGQDATKEEKRLEIERFTFIDKNESLKADKGIYTNDLIDLFKNIRYSKDTYTISTQRAQYDLNNQIIKVLDPFILTSPKMEVHGAKMTIWRKLGKIEAQKIKAKIESSL